MYVCVFMLSVYVFVNFSIFSYALIRISHCEIYGIICCAIESCVLSHDSQCKHKQRRPNSLKKNRILLSEEVGDSEVYLLYCASKQDYKFSYQ